MADTLSQALLEASLLSSIPEEDEGSIVIDVDRRTMVLPNGFFFGVYNDKDILRVPFVIPRYYNELDLSEFQITVNYINSAGYGNIYRVTDAEVTDSAIRFKWVTGRGVFVKEGTVRFIVCLRQIGTGGEVEKEFNTTIASANVLKGLEVDENPDPVAYSILAHMEELKDQAEAAVDVVEGAADRIDDAVTEAEQAIAAMYHSPYVAPTAADMLSHDKVYVYTGNETGYTFGNWYYWNGSAFVSGGVYNATAFETDATLTQSGKAADAGAVGYQFNKRPKIVESTEEDVDLDVCDDNGNVLVRFSDGHVKTKNFDSEDIKDEVDGIKEELIQLPRVDGSDATGVDLDISDDDGNVILRLADGHIKTKKFDSSNIAVGEVPLIDGSDATGVDLDITDKYGNVVVRFKDGHVFTKKFSSTDIDDIENALDEIETIIETFSKKIVYDASITNTITINHGYKKGDEIWFHLNDSQEFWDYGRYATYYEGSKVIANNRRGSNGYFRHIITADCNSVGITISSGEYTNGTELTLDVYRIIGEVKPKIVTVKADGTGMFTTIKAAVDSITDANHITNPYVIEVYPGTYDTLEGYTDEEIESAGDVEHYTNTSMVGVKLTDGISMRGVGRADEIVLIAELNSSTWSQAVRGEISTLNLQGEGSLENMTIIGKSIRYCIHDDFRSPMNSHDKRILRNLIFKGEYLSYYPFFTTYGAGMTQPRDYLIENCDFGYDLGIHSSGGYTYGCTIEVNNCSGCKFRVGDNASDENDAVNRVVINNCNFQAISINRSNANLSSHMKIEGAGNEQSMIVDVIGAVYNLGMVERFPTGLTAGTLAKRASSGYGVEATSDPSIALGIVIGSDSDYSYIQTEGYISSVILGLSGLSVGDYVTVDASTHLIVDGGTANDAVGVVQMVGTSGDAYIKMLI